MSLRWAARESRMDRLNIRFIGLAFFTIPASVWERDEKASVKHSVRPGAWRPRRFVSLHWRFPFGVVPFSRCLSWE